MKSNDRPCHMINNSLLSSSSPWPLDRPVVQESSPALARRYSTSLTALETRPNVISSYFTSSHVRLSKHLSAIMPVHPSEEETQSGITEVIAKNPSSNTESTASDHPIHHGHHGDDKVKAQAKDFNATPGPVIPQSADDLGEPASKDELKARAAELNKE